MLYAHLASPVGRLLVAGDATEQALLALESAAERLPFDARDRVSC